MNAHETQNDIVGSRLVSYDQWLISQNLSRPTGYRYRQLGYIKVVNRFGKLYITREEIARFDERTLAGEFARKAPTFTKKKVEAPA